MSRPYPLADFHSTQPTRLREPGHRYELAEDAISVDDAVDDVLAGRRVDAREVLRSEKVRSMRRLLEAAIAAKGNQVVPLSMWLGHCLHVSDQTVRDWMEICGLQGHFASSARQKSYLGRKLT